ncbi:MAG: hypothetical protein IKZ62_00015 [Prevotella sp.]|nr:hypothetical protein [Prevotella sp.]
MKLDKRIQKDLKDLYNGGATPGVIKDALGLNGLIQTKTGQTSFATKALPGYYTGNRKAKTVMVMLNPGIDVNVANNNLICDILKASMVNAGDVKGYHKWCANYGHIDKSRQDNFDLKQAFFLHYWKNTDIALPKSLCAKPKSDSQTLLDAKEIVLTEKLQLELIPYASSSFSSFTKGKISLVFPFVETLFDEIFSQDRTYVIFCSRKFERVFKEYNKKHPGSIDFKGFFSQNIDGSKIKGSCTKICIHYNNKSLNAIIANTFPNQALPNAYYLMEEYGTFCYNVFNNIP